MSKIIFLITMMLGGLAFAVQLPAMKPVTENQILDTQNLENFEQDEDFLLTQEDEDFLNADPDRLNSSGQLPESSKEAKALDDSENIKK